jgi:2'-5' RNA ligase
VPAAKVHLTLAFLGDVGDDRLEAIRSAASRLRCKAFDVTLDQAGCFRGARVAWIGSRKPARGLIELHEALAGELAACGFPPDERPYTPHATVARKISRQVERRAIAPIEWRARELSLVRSEPGKGSYETLAGWSLG